MEKDKKCYTIHLNERELTVLIKWVSFACEAASEYKSKGLKKFQNLKNTLEKQKARQTKCQQSEKCKRSH